MVDANEWDERYGGSELLWSKEPNRFVAELVAPLRPGRALDVACGEGRNAIWLASRGWEVVALDFSRVALERARRLAGKAAVSISWTESDLLRDDLPDGPFDLVLLSYLHLPQPAMGELWKRAAGRLAPGGRLLVLGHAKRNLSEGTGGPQDEALLYQPEEVVLFLPGLDVLRADEVTRDLGEGPEARQAIDTLVLARRPAA